MKKRAIILSAFLATSLMLTGCTWNDIKAKFTGADTTGAVSGAAINLDDYKPEDYVTVPEYKGIEVDCKVGDDEVEAEIEYFLGENSTEDKIKKGKCKSGQTVNIDYVGKMDGEAFDNGSATDQTITLGASGFIDGFDDGVIGMKVGETKDIDVTFPEDYASAPDLAGKPAVFTVTLNYISKTVTPKLTDDLVKEKTEYKTVDEYKEGTRNKIKEEKKNNAGSTAYGKVEEGVQIKSYPEELMSVYSAQMDAYYRASAKQYGFQDFNTFLTQSGMDEATYKTYLEDAAKANVKTQLATRYIAAKEGIEVTDEEIASEIKSNMESAGQTEEEFRKSYSDLYGTQMTLEQYYEIVLLTNKIVDFVGENAKIVE